jgi:hypothetical protein
MTADEKMPVSRAAAPRPLESANASQQAPGVPAPIAKQPQPDTQPAPLPAEQTSDAQSGGYVEEAPVQPAARLEKPSSEQGEDSSYTAQPGKRTSKELPPGMKDSLKQATVNFVKDAVGGIACASLAGPDAEGVLFSLDKTLQSFSLTQSGAARTYPLVDIREILIGKDSARFLACPTAATLREDELRSVVDIQLTSGIDEHLFLDSANDAYRFVQAMSVLRLYRGSQR